MSASPPQNLNLKHLTLFDQSTVPIAPAADTKLLYSDGDDIVYQNEDAEVVTVLTDANSTEFVLTDTVTKNFVLAGPTTGADAAATLRLLVPADLDAALAAYNSASDVLLATTKKLKFRDTALYVYSSVDGQLDIAADAEVQIDTVNLDINATTVDFSAAVAIGTTLGIIGVTTPTGGIAAAGGFATKARLIHTGGIPARVNTDGSDATPVATEVYIGEVFVEANVTVTGVSVFNGSVASGNMKVGLADSSGAIVATSASTAISGTDAYQRVAFTAPLTVKGPASYFVVLFIDNGTARYNAHTFGDFGASKQTGQTYSTGFTTITPPTTFTTALAPIASLY